MLLIILLRHSLKHTKNESLHNKLYIMMLQITTLMLFMDIFGRFDGLSGTIFPVLNHFGNLMLFLLSPILPSLWLLYVHCQVSHEESIARRRLYPLIAINAVNAVFLVLSQFFNWFYYIDSDNIYHRGPLFMFSASITVVLVLIAFVFIVINRKNIERKYYISLVFFAVPPFMCIFLQILFYGISLMLNGVVLSFLILYLNIQNHSMYTDYLTGVNNRKNLDTYLKNKVNASTEDKTFSAIMIDLDNFKSINDTFGHDMGDNALETSAKLLKSCLKSDDFIARFGGDEFCVVLDVSDRIDLEAIVNKINECIEKYNEANTQSYKLGFSMGYAVYDCHSNMKAEEFQKQIDMLMYANKWANKEKKY